MKSFVIKKLFIFLLSIFAAISVTFFLMHAIPGDPFTQDKAIPEEIMRSMYKHYGMDRPLFMQYLYFLKGIVTANLGPSLKYEGRNVMLFLKEGFPVSLTLGLEALFIAIPLGILIGSLAAMRHEQWQDRLLSFLAILGISVPSFIIATFLQYLFAMKLSWLPVARWGSFSQTVLPALSLACLPISFIARLTRSSMLEVFKQEYIQTARAKGLSEMRILFFHVLRNSLLPVLTYLGPLSAMIITGSFIIEKIFGIPGLGQWFVLSVINRDYTVIMGITIFYCSLLLFMVLLTDILYHFLDPRIKHQTAHETLC